MRAFGVLIILLAAVLPVANAQAPGPSTGIAVSLPPGPVDIPLGASHELPLKITFTAANFACAQDATVMLPITVAGSPTELPSVTARPSVVAAKFTIPAGVYQDATAAGNGPYNKSIDATLTIMVGADAPANHRHAFQVTVTYPDGTPTGCQATSDLPKATGGAQHQLVTGASSGSNASARDMRGMSGMSGMTGMSDAEMNGQGSETPSATPAPEAKKTPGASTAVLLALGAAVALVARKRR